MQLVKLIKNCPTVAESFRENVRNYKGTIWDDRSRRACILVSSFDTGFSVNGGAESKVPIKTLFLIRLQAKFHFFFFIYFYLFIYSFIFFFITYVRIIRGMPYRLRCLT